MRHEGASTGAGHGKASAPTLPAVSIDLVEINYDDAPNVLALQLAPGQERFVSSVAYSLKEAAENPDGNPWFRAVSPPCPRWSRHATSESVTAAATPMNTDLGPSSG